MKFATQRSGTQSGLGIYWSNWLVGTITTLALAMLFWPVLAWVWNKLGFSRGGARS